MGLALSSGIHVLSENVQLNFGKIETWKFRQINERLQRHQL